MVSVPRFPDGSTRPVGMWHFRGVMNLNHMEFKSHIRSSPINIALGMLRVRSLPKDGPSSTNGTLKISKVTYQRERYGHYPGNDLRATGTLEGRSSQSSWCRISAVRLMILNIAERTTQLRDQSYDRAFVCGISKTSMMALHTFRFHCCRM